MIYEQKEESKEEAAIRILTCIANEFKINHEATVCFEQEIVLDAISFLEYAENENKLIKAIKRLKPGTYGSCL